MVHSATNNPSCDLINLLFSVRATSNSADCPVASAPSCHIPSYPRAFGPEYSVLHTILPVSHASFLGMFDRENSVSYTILCRPHTKMCSIFAGFVPQPAHITHILVFVPLISHIFSWFSFLKSVKLCEMRSRGLVLRLKLGPNIDLRSYFYFCCEFSVNFCKINTKITLFGIFACNCRGDPIFVIILIEISYLKFIFLIFI